MRKQMAPEDLSGCSFVLDDGSGKPGAVPGGFCNAPRQPGSAYCPGHHALCHLATGSAGERRHLREIEALAKAVGGRQGRVTRQPPPPLLRRLERTARAASHAPAQSDAAPTPERRQHGKIERLERTIADSAGHPGRPYRAVDTLALMQRRGSISPGMRQAGEDFRSRFTVAQLDPLRALDLSHLRLGDAGTRPEHEGPGLRIEAARKAVWRAVQAVGGIASPAGSCLWHVVGWECSLKEWALGQGWSGRRVSQEAASGILVAALGALEAHFGLSRSLPKSHFIVDKSGSV
jgi:hypothetical protein